MTLAEFVALAKSAGVRDDDQIAYIDISEPFEGQEPQEAVQLEVLEEGPPRRVALQ